MVEIIVSEEELSECPNCEGDIKLIGDGIESMGDGTAIGYIECEDCGFEAREDWKHRATVCEV